jgi:hypothetical membrane protein
VGFLSRSLRSAGNWLSNLGNNVLNPDGALFYRLGGILGGLGLAGFFLTLDGRTWGQRRTVRVFSALVRTFGTIASASFIMTGVFSEDMMPMHSWFSIANYAAFGTAIALTGIARLSGAALPMSFAVLCFAAWLFDIAAASTTERPCITRRPTASEGAPYLSSSAPDEPLDPGTARTRFPLHRSFFRVSTL